MVWLFTTKYGENVKFCYMDTDDGFIAHVKTDDIYKDIAEDVEKKVTQTLTSIWYEIDQPLPKGKNEEVMGLMKDELARQIME